MKEKRIDVYLAKASSYFLLLLGFGGAFLNEVLKEEARMVVAVTAGPVSVILLMEVARLYRKADNLSRKLKRKS